MSTIGTYAHTLSDMRKQLNPDGSIDRVMEVLNQSNPMMEDIPWMEGNLPIGNQTTVRASLPTPSIRRINQGVAATKGTAKQHIDVCMFLEDRSCIDTLLLKGRPNPEQYRMSEDDAHVEGMGQYVAQQLIYGDLDADPDTFNGFMKRYNIIGGAKGSAGYQVISGGLAGSNTNGSMLFVDWGDRRVAGVYPKNTIAGLHSEDLGEGDVHDASGKTFRAVQTLYQWTCGLTVQNVRSVARVANVNIAGLKSLTQAAGQALIDQFIYGKNLLWQPKNPIIYVPETLYAYLETWLTNKANIHITRQEVMGAAPVLYFSGMRVKKMECMSETEGAVSSAS